jgi:hypothetical protein
VNVFIAVAIERNPSRSVKHLSFLFLAYLVTVPCMLHFTFYVSYKRHISALIFSVEAFHKKAVSSAMNECAYGLVRDCGSQHL